MRLTLLFILSLLHVTCARADEWWAWTFLEMPRPPWSGGIFMANRMDTDDASYVQLVSPRVKYAVTPWLDLGLNLSYLEITPPATGDTYHQIRPELELNPKVDLTRQLRLEWRNRMEWRKNEGEDLTISRTRHRLQLAWTLPAPAGPLTRVFINDEWFFDLHLRHGVENRVVPLGFTFKLASWSDLDCFYMIDSTRTPDGWRHESVIGTYLRLRF
jgi:hypothetical protein